MLDTLCLKLFICKIGLIMSVSMHVSVKEHVTTVSLSTEYGFVGKRESFMMENNTETESSF